MYAIGIDLGATNVRVALSDPDGHFLSNVKEITEKSGSLELIDQIGGMVDGVIHGSGAGLEEVVGIGIGSVGPLDIRRGTASPTNLPFGKIPLVGSISDRFHLPVYLLNDCNAAALGEKWFGIAGGRENFAYITLSSGVGGGVFVNGKLLLGKDGNAAEIGHFTIDMDQKLRCGCGKWGHWEAYCSGVNIPKFVGYWIAKMGWREEDSSIVALSRAGDLTAKCLFQMAQNDSLALKIVREIGRLNAIGFASIIDAYDPSLITVGGAIALNNEHLTLDPIREGVGEHARNALPEIMLTSLGSDVVLYGAAALALHHEEADEK